MVDSYMFKSIAENKEIKILSREALEHFHLKMPVFNMLTKINQEKALQKLEKIAQNSKIKPKIYSKKKKVLFNVVNGSYDLEIYRHAGVAKALHYRGHPVEILICNRGIDICTAFFRIGHPHNNGTCNNCTNFSKKFCEITDLPYSSFTDYINKEEIKIIEKQVKKLSLEECEKLQYKNVSVGDHASLSAMRYFKGSIPSKEKFEPVLRLELKASMVSTAVSEKIFKTKKPDVVVSGSVYSPWGTVSDYFRNKGVRVCHNNLGYLFFTMNVSDNDSSFGDFKKYYNEVRKKQGLNKKEKEELYSFLNKRRAGKEGGGDTFLYGFKEEFKDLDDYFNTNKYDRTYALFPNVPWDASLTRANKAFKDVYDWTSSSIDLFKENPNLQLIIKIHPGEKLSESENTISDYIKRNYVQIPDNIKILPPDTPISPYNLFSIIDAGIVYNGTPGIEMALEGIPSIVTGVTHYNNLGFTNDITSKNQYKDLILKGNYEKPDKNLTEVFMYFFFIKTYVPLNYIYSNSFLDLGWRIKSLDDFAPGKDNYLDKIADYTVNGGIFQEW